MDLIGHVHWENTMDEKMSMLDVNETWCLVPLLEDKQAIGYKFFYKLKHKAYGSIERHKPRLVAREAFVISYQETFSHIVASNKKSCHSNGCEKGGLCI